VVPFGVWSAMGTLRRWKGRNEFGVSAIILVSEISDDDFAIALLLIFCGLIKQRGSRSKKASARPMTAFLHEETSGLGWA